MRHAGREPARRAGAVAAEGAAVPECPILLLPLAIADAISAEDCARIRNLAAEGPRRVAGLVGGVHAPDIRRADLCWLDDCAGAEWVSDRLVEIVARSNRTHFGFDLSDFAESAQVARYAAEASGHFGWHSDIGAGQVAKRRKLTLVLQLSDPSDYEGGALELSPDGTAREASRAQGTAILFPAFTPHRVTPVSWGERFSLTIWAHGPDFR